jgi:protein phosphatase
MVRDHNEDFAHVDDRMGFFIVADGMGGHAAGEVASRLAVEEVAKHLDKNRELLADFEKDPSEKVRKALVTELEVAVREAHRAVFETGAKDAEKQGMGTTLDVVLLAGSEAFVAHVGDSRTYLVRGGKASQLTTDHTVAEVLLIEGKLSVEEAQVSPLRTILVNAIGVAPDVGVEMAHIRLQAGDRLLVCSDGLHDYFPAEQELADKIKSDQDPEKALRDMVELAKSRGGHDNITGILVDVEWVPEVAAEDTAGIDDEETGIAEKPMVAEDTMPEDEFVMNPTPAVDPPKPEPKKNKKKQKNRGKASTVPASPRAIQKASGKKSEAKEDSADANDKTEPLSDSIPGPKGE